MLKVVTNTSFAVEQFGGRMRFLCLPGYESETGKETLALARLGRLGKYSRMGMID